MCTCCEPLPLNLTYSGGADFHSGEWINLWLHAGACYFWSLPTAELCSMTDDLKKKRGPADRTRVNVNEKWEVDYWCGKFKCTEIELKDAVKLVGSMATAVHAHLSRKHQTRVQIDWP
jgi:hypothetical protein